MSLLRLYSLYDSGVSAYCRPFWSDHKTNAMRAIQHLVNDNSDPNNMVSAHPDQFTLFELATFDSATGEFLAPVPLSLGNCIEFVTVNNSDYCSSVAFDALSKAKAG